MATKNGAAALAADGQLGSLAPGREARMLAIRQPSSFSEIFEFLTTVGKEARIKWVK
jgi:cytosine/adenosine deaminase-related metal-dependent hydrolase